MMVEFNFLGELSLNIQLHLVVENSYVTPQTPSLVEGLNFHAIRKNKTQLNSCYKKKQNNIYWTCIQPKLVTLGAYLNPAGQTVWRPAANKGSLKNTDAKQEVCVHDRKQKTPQRSKEKDKINSVK